jgi:hypothetical protein
VPRRGRLAQRDRLVLRHELRGEDERVVQRRAVVGAGVEEGRHLRVKVPQR